MSPGSLVVALQARPERAGSTLSISGAYQRLLLFYLVTLLYLYPYGITVGDGASIRPPDLVGILCVLVGIAALVVRGRLRIDMLFLAALGPFILLELAAPTLGAIAYRKPMEVASSLRMALLWLPPILLTMIASSLAEPRFDVRIRLLLTVTLWLNAAYALAQIAVDFGFAPEWLAFTRLLQPWAVDRHFDVVLGLRPAGFFVNTTALSVFGIVCLAYFYAHYIAGRSRRDLWLSLLSMFVVILTTSRAAVAGALLIVWVGWFALTGGRKAVVLTVTLIASAALAAAIESTIGLETAFHRFTRLAESGLLGDVSFGMRVNEIWPAALAVARQYPLGTWISAPAIAALIDSGYLNYYIQGRWFFLAVLATTLAGLVVLGMRHLRRPHTGPGGLIVLFLALYIALAMVVANPARSPILIAMLVFAFWKMKNERRARDIVAAVGRQAGQ